MKRILELMDQKNHFLEKFYTLNENSLVLFLKEQFDSINSFYENRESLLEILRHIDAEINKNTTQNSAHEERDVLQISKLKTSLAVKDTYVAKIIEQDLAILACIESAKNSIIKELQDVKKGKKVVHAYKVPQFTNKLEEEL